MAEILDRSAWNARRPTSVSYRITPAKGGCAIHWEGPAMGEYRAEQVPALLRGIQNFHMNTRGWSDIAYTALVDRFGRVWSARGPGIRTASQGTNEGNQNYYGICGLWGKGDPFTDAAKTGVLNAVEWLRVAGGAGGSVRPHRAFHATECPGMNVVAWIEAGMPRPGPPPPPTGDDLRSRIMAKPVLRVGDSGHDVKILQALLIAHAPDLVGTSTSFVDGDFGPRTRRVLTTWQERTGRLNPDGTTSAATWAWLCNV